MKQSAKKLKRGVRGELPQSSLSNLGLSAGLLSALCIGLFSSQPAGVLEMSG